MGTRQHAQLSAWMSFVFLAGSGVALVIRCWPSVFAGEELSLCAKILTKILTFLFLLHPFRTVLLGTTEESSQKAAAGDPALCWLLVCPAIATTTAMSVTPKLESVWYVRLGGS